MRRFGSFACSLLVLSRRLASPRAWAHAQATRRCTGRRLDHLRPRSGRRAILAARQHPPRQRRDAPGRLDVSHRRRVRAEERTADGLRSHAAPRRRHAVSEHARRPGHRARPRERPAAMGLRRQSPSRQRLRRFREPRRVHVEPRQRAPHLRRDHRRAPHRARREDRNADPRLRGQGTVDLRKGLRIAPTGFADYQVTSPPAVVGDTVVVGSAISDGTSKIHPSGEVRGFDAITGKTDMDLGPRPADSIGRRGRFVEERRAARAAPTPGR